MKGQGPKIAIVPSFGLGDTLLWLVFANNLQRNGYQVTYFSDHSYQLRAWLKNITVEPTPKKENIDQAFMNFDLVLAEIVSIITKDVAVADYPKLAKRYVFITQVSFCPPELIYDSSSQQKAKLVLIAKASGLALTKMDKVMPMAGRIAKVCKDVFGLNEVVNSCGFVAPIDLTAHKYPARIMIQPTSSNIIKNWSPKKFMGLAKKLQQNNWEPVFCVAPSEFQEWQRILNNKFELKKFPTLEELAKFIYESAYMIGNDSGVGHLASALGVPTLTIIRQRRKFYRWRPGWVAGIVVSPKIKAPFYCYSWKYLISVQRVYKAFQSLVAEYKANPR